MQQEGEEMHSNAYLSPVGEGRSRDNSQLLGAQSSGIVTPGGESMLQSLRYSIYKKNVAAEADP